VPVDRDGQPSTAKVAVEDGSANVYADLGRSDADEMLVKAQLTSRIGEVIERRRLTQVAAAEITGLPQPKLSGLLRGQFRGVSEAKMLACLTRLGRAGTDQVEVQSG
jgi:predicted XRE-type DNA-binding protein